MSSDEIGALELEIVRGRLQSVVDEAGAVIVSTAFSAIVREGKDFACVLLAPDGRTIVQSTGVPVFLGTTTNTAQRLLEILPPAAWEPGAVVGTNDVWLGTGHLYDLTLVMPVFVDGEIVALSSVVVHLPDIGGRGWGREARQVFEEGFQIPPMRLGSTDGFEPLLLDLLRANVRRPEEVTGDMEAALNALAVMTAQLAALCNELTPARFERVWRGLEARTETVMRARIAELPPGRRRASIDTDEVDGMSVHVELEISIEGGELIIDLTGSSPQVPAAINCSFPYARAYVIFALKCLLAPDLPLNEGAVRNIRVIAPEGSVVNSRFPAAGGARNIVGMYLPPLIFRAMEDVMPAEIVADSAAPPPILTITGVDAESAELFAGYLEVPGGFGARAASDGVSVMQFPANTRLMSIEALEATTPVLFHRRELIPDSGGRGRFRGGLGQRVSFAALSWPAYVAILAERMHDPPAGLRGGEPGSATRIFVDDVQLDEVSKPVRLDQGEVLTIESSGGGGYGPPGDRSQAAVQRDVENGYVTNTPLRLTWEDGGCDAATFSARVRAFPRGHEQTIDSALLLCVRGEVAVAGFAVAKYDIVRTGAAAHCTNPGDGEALLLEIVERGTADDDAAHLPWQESLSGFTLRSPLAQQPGNRRFSGPFLNAGGLASHLVRSPHGEGSPWHALPGDLLVVQLEGEVRFDAAGASWRLAPLDLLLIPAHVPYRYENVGSGDALFFDVFERPRPGSAAVYYRDDPGWPVRSDAPLLDIPAA